LLTRTSSSCSGGASCDASRRWDPKNATSYPLRQVPSRIRAAARGAGLPSTTGGPNNATYDPVDTQDHPINFVSWFQAETYCAWRGKRLCTEAEWERAARGGCETLAGDCRTGMRKYPWGSAEPTCDNGLANFAELPGADPQDPPQACCDGTTPVGSFPAGASPYGALDMAGQLWEWVADWYDHAYDAGPVTDPTGPEFSPVEGRVIRGGFFRSLATSIRASRRTFDPPTNSYKYYGPRCCRGVPAP